MPRVLVTGGTGLVGTALKNLLQNRVVCVGSEDYDLRDFDATRQMFEDHKGWPDDPISVIHLAAKVGGVKANTDYVADFFTDNLRINANVMYWANKYNVYRMVSMLSTCIYPDKVEWPIRSEALHFGPPHSSNFGYAYAKRMLEVGTRAYNQQYGRNWITVVPNNIYGPHDNFDLENGHVIPSVIRKIYEAMVFKDEAVFWGDGSALRQFTYSEDIAKMIWWALGHWDQKVPLNIGSTPEFSITCIVQLVCDHIGYDFAKVRWDTSKPAGQHRKPSYIELERYGYDQKQHTITSGLIKTIEWFNCNYPNVRGVISKAL